MIFTPEMIDEIATEHDLRIDDVEYLAERVQRGAQVLTSLDAGWRQHVSVSRLDMLSPRLCVLGQWGPQGWHYQDPYYASLLILSGAISAVWARDHGFELGDGDGRWSALTDAGYQRRCRAWDALTSLWRHVIANR